MTTSKRNAKHTLDFAHSNASRHPSDHGAHGVCMFLFVVRLRSKYCVHVDTFSHVLQYIQCTAFHPAASTKCHRDSRLALLFVSYCAFPAYFSVSCSAFFFCCCCGCCPIHAVCLTFISLFEREKNHMFS